MRAGHSALPSRPGNFATVAIEGEIVKNVIIATLVASLAATIGLSANGGTKTIGKMIYNQAFDPITAKSIPDVSTRSESGEVLMWWCHPADGRFVTALHSGKYFAAPDTVTVAYQFSGANQPTEVAWRTDHYQSAWLTGERLAQFTHQAQENDRVQVRIRDTDGGIVTADFDLEGLRDALELLPCAAKELATTY
jgi:hypothetical protein